MDLRERVMAAYEAGRQTKEIAKTFGVSPAWARRLKQHKRERGDIRPRTGGATQVSKVDAVRLQALVDQKPDATLAELRESLKVDCSTWTICKALKRLKLTYKKSRFVPPNKTGRMSPSSERNGRSCNWGSIHRL